MYRTLLLLLCTLFSSFSIKAQQIKGMVVNDDNSPISFAMVSLLHSNDSTYICGGICREDGTFSFDTSAKNKLIRISYIGYKTTILPTADSMRVVLSSDEQELKEVTVVAHRPTFKLSKGMFISNIQGTAFSKLGKAIDVLKQLPLMNLDGKSVLGRGVPLVYINNKLMRNWSELERITSDMIKEIKIDMNPGAKYGSNVRAVLFITTVKPIGEGLGGTLVLTESVSSCWATNGMIDLNYRKNNFDIFITSSYNTFSNSHYKRQDDYKFLHKSSLYDAAYTGDGYNSAKNGFVSVGFNHQLTKKQSLGGTYMFTRLFSSTSQQHYHNRVMQDNILSEYDTHSGNFSQSGSHSLSLYYENQISDKLELNIDAAYVNNNGKSRQNIIDMFANKNTKLIPLNKTNSELSALKTLFTSSIGEGKLEYGFEATHTQFQQKHNVENTDYTGVLTSNDNKSRQTATNIFANYSRSLGKMYLQLGVKYEYANYDYYSNGNHLKDNSRTYHRILPSASLSYDISKMSFMLSYNIYTNNPTYSQLDEWLRYISNFRYNKGNSLLKTNYEHEISLNASYKDFTFMGNYSYEKDAIITWFDLMEETPAIVSSDLNHSYSNLYATLTYAPTFFRIWKPSWSVWANKQWLSYSGMDYKRPQFGLQWKNLLILPKQWFILVNASGNLKGNAGTYMAHAAVRLGITIQKDMKDWRFYVNASNLTNAKEKGYSTYPNIYTSHNVDYLQPTISLTVSYSFNPAKSKYKGQTAGQSERNRL